MIVDQEECFIEFLDTASDPSYCYRHEKVRTLYIIDHRVVVLLGNGIYHLDQCELTSNVS